MEVHKKNLLRKTKEEEQSSSFPSSFENTEPDKKPDKPKELDSIKDPIDDLIDSGMDFEKNDSIEFITPKGQKRFIDSTVIYRHFLKLPYTREIIQAAIQKYKKEMYPVSNILKYLESICKTIESNKPLKKTPKQDITLEPDLEKYKSKHKFVKGLFECTKSTILPT